ncbi:MAG: hypothetical protein HON68_12090 [Gammaproteobacteria bacterium]|jgi:hypothetical protein|nr:hypothetical protein [Gammaproteobacteria bacterium]MBT3489002.1 hypothetical protein [Gammaproteobacteria bacterium]MBT3719192.1 hypothetical protein [Gammaproteobacteria bacterium]MBT3845016.1 hypothetical protein [Gammaproteobacteria bacterium]MBT3894313.1 hypothetical protein [Gammaproteobacteria bacterium]
MSNKLLYIGFFLSMSVLSLTVQAEEERSWFKSWGEKIGLKAREVTDKADPDGSLQEKAKTTYEGSKQYLGEHYDTAEQYVKEKKESWKSDGGIAYEAVKQKTKEMVEGARQGYGKRESE